MLCALLRRVGVQVLFAPAMRRYHANPDKLSLPRQERLPDGTTLTVDFMTSKQMSECYRMIEDDMRSGIGFHPEEFSSFTNWQSSIENGLYVTIAEAATSAMVCGIVISRCAWVRLPHCCEGILVVQPDRRRRGLGELAVSLSLEFSLALGYRNVMADPYSNNTAMLQLLRAHGFRHVGTIPTGQVAPSGEPVQILLMLKSFGGGMFSPKSNL